jgi:hypothetical protein
MLTRNSALLLLTMTILLMATPGRADNEVPEYTTDGLKLVEQDSRGEIYADPDADWSVYTAIMLNRPTVAFRKNWQRDQNRYGARRVTASDMERIRNGLADQFEEVFTEELTTNGGYTMAEQAGDQVMQITPHIVDLDIAAPDTPTSSYSRSYTDSAGRMTLKLAIHDSVTGDLIATASDRREDPRRGYMQWSNSVTNKAESRQMLQRWAKDLRERLDRAREGGPAAD